MRIGRELYRETAAKKQGKAARQARMTKVQGRKAQVVRSSSVWMQYL
jgi:hypothetical protein